MIQKLFFLALVLLPFTGIKGVPGLGEIQNEAAAYVFIVMMGLSILPVLAHFGTRPTQSQEKVYLLPRIAAVIFSVIAISFIANFPTIREAQFMGRTGLGKFVTCCILFVYGFGIAYLTYFLSARQAWDKMLVRPLTISVLICAVFSFFELAAQQSGGMAALFQIISAPIYGSLTSITGWDTRLRSVAFEPPDFANTAGYIWPWLLAAVLHARGKQRLFFGIVFGLLNGMIVLSETRTSLVVIGGMLLALVGLRFVLNPKKPVVDVQQVRIPLTILFWLVVPACLFLLAYYYDRLVYSVVAGDNVSNLSRLASITAAIRMFADHPIFGWGYGQFGFLTSQYMPGWGYYSWEVKAWMFGVNEEWPAVYSVYARFAADMGILGLAMWAGLWLWLARTLLFETLKYRKETGLIPFAAQPLIMSCFCVLCAGLASDSVRAPMIWINMGLICRYLISIKTKPLPVKTL